MKEKCYSVIKSNKAMCMQTLSLIRVYWINKQFLIPKLLKCYYNMISPRPKCKLTWDVSKVLQYFKNVYPLKKLTLKMLTLKSGVGCVHYCCKGPAPLCI